MSPSHVLRVLGLALALAACGGEVATPRLKPVLDTNDCRFKVHSTQRIGDTVSCGTMATRAEHDVSGALVVQVPYVVFHRSSVPSDYVTVMLSGGPGQSWADLGLDQLPSDYNQYLPYDYLFIEQRGTGKSTPLLSCGVQQAGQDSGAFIDACLKNLKNSPAPLEAFNTVELAYDVTNLRHALGYQQMILSGVSYGTRWALEIMRIAPDHVVGALLDSVVAPTVPPFSQRASAEDAALKALFAACAADSKCAAEGDLKETFAITLALFAKRPLAEDEASAGDVFRMTLATLEQTPEYAPSFIRWLHRMAREGQSLPVTRNNDAMALGQYLSVECSDNQFVTNAMVDADLATVDPLWREHVSTATSLVSLCAHWPFKRRDRFEAVTSNIPTLLLAGTFDYRTPTVWARAAKETLSNANLLVVAGAAHQVDRGDPCVRSIVHGFIESLDANRSDRCLDSMAPAFKDATYENPTRHGAVFNVPRIQLY